VRRKKEKPGKDLGVSGGIRTAQTLVGPLGLGRVPRSQLAGAVPPQSRKLQCGNTDRAICSRSCAGKPATLPFETHPRLRRRAVSHALTRHSRYTRGIAVPSYVLTGAPGAGKTAILRLLEANGFPVVEEAATDVIALGHAFGNTEPWQDPDFIDKVLVLQRQRQESIRESESTTVFFDRSPACTLALSRYLGFTASRLLGTEVSRVIAERTYEPLAFFIRNQGFVQPTPARQISFQDSLAFERLHEQVYRELGFQLVEVPAGPLADRVALIRQTVSQNHKQLPAIGHGHGLRLGKCVH